MTEEFDYKVYIGNLTDICNRKKIAIKELFILSQDLSIHEVAVNPHIKFPRLLILSGVTAGESSGSMAICRFLDKYPVEDLSKIGIDIIPIAGFSKTPEKGFDKNCNHGKLIDRHLKGKRHNLCLILKDNPIAYNFSLYYSSSSLSLLTQYVLDTASLFFPVYRATDDALRAISLEVGKDKVEEYIKKHNQTEYISIMMPSCYSTHERISCGSKIIEDCINHLQGNY